MTSTAPDPQISNRLDKADNLVGMFLATAQDRALRMAVQADHGGLSFTYKGLLDEAACLASGLMAHGVKRGDAVALMLTNRPEFFPFDLAALFIGAIPFSLYNSASASQLVYVLGDSGARVVVCERAFHTVVLEARSLGAQVDTIIVVDDDQVEGGLSIDALKAKASGPFDLAAAAAAVSPDDVATLIYTSGSTGAPKGVELTHSNLLAEIRAIHKMVPHVQDGRYISFLPAAHIGDRARSYYGSVVSFGHDVMTVADAKDLVAAMKLHRPTYCGGPPRIWEKIRAGIEARHGHDIAERAAKDPSLGAEIREELGLDKALWISTGSAPTQSGQFDFYEALGIRLCELWGMTETCSIATTNTPTHYRFGSVGRGIPGLGLKLAEDGELLVRGPTVTSRYRNRPEAVAESFDEDGWFCTGDIARVDEDGYWWIVDRKKDIMINAAGKNMSPSNIESALKASSPWIMQACVVGDRRPYNVALIVIDKGLLQGSDPNSPQVAANVQAAVDRANRQLSRVEQVKRFALLANEWSAGGDELTPTMKLKRREIEAKYAGLIDGLYV